MSQPPDDVSGERRRHDGAARLPSSGSAASTGSSSSGTGASAAPDHDHDRDDASLLSRSQLRTARANRHHEVRRSLALTASSIVLPGLGLVFTRRRRLGLAMALTTLILGLFATYWLLSNGLLNGLSQFVTARGLLLLLGVFVIGGLAWITGIMLTAQETVENDWSGRAIWVQRIFATLLCLVVAVPAARGAQYVLITRDAFGAMSTDRYTGRGASTVDPGSGADPWKNIPRVNVLLLGSDAGPDRFAVRTDSIIVASIDTRTGNTALISIPRNLQKVPFPSDNPLHKIYPNGFNCGNECLMDAVWTEAGINHKDKFPASEKNPGLNTTREVVSQITGLGIDYTTVIDLSGFAQLVDAMGGVEITVPQRLPMGGTVANGQVNLSGVKKWLEPGHQRLNGKEALWYSRSRATTSDDDRMKRQRCMVNALVDQSNPVSMLEKFPAIMRAAEDNISYDIPQDELPAFVKLVQTMQKGKMTSVNLSPPTIKGYDPDYPKIRQLVQRGINPPKPTAPPRSASPSSSSASTSTTAAPVEDTANSC